MPDPVGEVEASALDQAVRAELRGLGPTLGDRVARHLVASGRLLDEDPEQALAHALVARRLAARIPAVREAAGLAAYHAGDWTTAVSELRAYHRMSGRQTHLAVLADCERALGRPERAIDMYRTADRDRLTRDEAVELLIVAAGARSDMGQHEAAVSMLQVRELSAEGPWGARLRYAYADALLRAGRAQEARAWFARAVDADEDGLTDAAERLLELDGVRIDDEADDDEADDDEADDDEADDDEADDEAGDGDPAARLRADADVDADAGGEAGHDPAGGGEVGAGDAWDDADGQRPDPATAPAVTERPGFTHPPAVTDRPPGDPAP